jgi:nucleotide-binding universal stress UspA family protein
MSERRTLVVGYDGSPASRAAVSWAVRRAGRSGRLVLVNAGRRHGGVLDRQSFELWVRDRVAYGQALIDELILERDDLIDVALEVEVIDDLPATALMEAARAHDADEIVIGTRQRGRLAALHGSVARELLERTDRPVILVPAADCDGQAAPMLPGAAASAASGALTPRGRTITGQLAAAMTRRVTPPRRTARSGP